MALKFSPERLKHAEFMVVLSLVLFGSMMVGAAFWASGGDVWAHITRLSPSLLVLILGLSLINYTFRGFRWHIFSKKLKHNVPPKRMAVYYLSGMSLVTTPGKIGTAMRVWLLKRCHNVSYTEGLPLMVMDPVTDLLSLFILSGIGLLAFPSYQWAFVGFSVFIAALLLFFAMPSAILGWVKSMFEKRGRSEPKVVNMVRKVATHITRLLNPAQLFPSIICSSIGWVAVIYGFMVVLHTMNAEVSFLQAMFIFSFATVIGGATMMPGGLGSTEATMVGLLVAIGVETDVAIAATAVCRLVTLWFGVLVGFLFLPKALSYAKAK